MPNELNLKKSSKLSDKNKKFSQAFYRHLNKQ